MKLFDVYPLFNITPVRASGSYLWDEQGNQYLDFYGGHAVISVGHGHPHYVKQLTNQLHQIGFYSNSVQIPIQSVLAQKLGEQSGYEEYQFFMCNSGAEANENAFKLASFHTGRKKIVAFEKSFHGRTSAAVAATDDPSIVAPVNETSNIIFCQWNDEVMLQQIFDTHEITAVIIEGIQGVGGVNIPKVSFLQKIKLVCDQHGALMICDEIQSGYGRSGKFFAHQHANIRPDIITVAKGMGNGFPVGGVLIHPNIKPKHGMLGTTFGGNYLACAAAIAVLDIIKQENLVSNASQVGQYLMQQLKGIPGIKEIRGLGLMIGIELQGPCAAIRNELLNDYKIFTGSASNKNTLRILPALNISNTEADIFITAFRNVMQKQFKESAAQA
ncbi:MAG: aminotransferase class III-fold pyridoxal phosphate-dependent enzyme [Bacteroidetes bacterium]|nr:aminotransferase class III-fold pyridoxal phosphate-dependent enzyme [Bacteroidota bacterium]